MNDSTMGRESHALRLVKARQQFFDRGDGSEGEGDGRLDGTLQREVLRSWARCRDRGMDCSDAVHGEPEGRSELSVARERSERLLRNASGIMEHVFEQIRASGSLVILADDQGVILHSLGDPELFSRAQ